MKQPGLYVVHAAAVRDAAGVRARPGAVLVRDGRIVAAGDPASLPVEWASQAQVIDRSSDLLLPAMINAHTHLELTAIGPQPYDPAGGFVGWVKRVRRRAPQTQDALIASMKNGAAIARVSGVSGVGDITSSALAADWLNETELAGVSYAELFGLGPPFDVSALHVIQSGRCGLQPHAPYSAGPQLFAAAAGSGRPVCTHLAETQEEAEFIASLTGPMFEFVRSLGRWNDTFAGSYGRGLTPVQWVRPYLERAAPDGG